MWLLVDCCALLLIAQLAAVQTPLFSAWASHRSHSSAEDVFWDGKRDTFSQGLWWLCGQHQCVCTKVCQLWMLVILVTFVV